MKKTIIIGLLILGPIYSIAQVGIKTSEPTQTLDVNGDLRIRQIVLGDIQNDMVMHVNTNGSVQNILQENLNDPNAVRDLKIVDAEDVIKEPDSQAIEEIFTVPLDLWSDQELYGINEIKNLYFVALRQRVTLPENITTNGDGKIRKITFVIIQNNAPEGFNDLQQSQSFDEWYVIFQTKKFELDAMTGEGCFVTDKTYLYEPYKYSGLFVPDPEGAYDANNNNAASARIKMRRQNQIRDRAIVFYDFNGQWIMSVRD